ncbi:hypothetical protein GCM10023403_03850 [Pseudonocardia benzenivorans]|jgi:hypothetical protein|nr:hypothetical protein PSD17_35570 [Pseudonocardia sp. D17]
MSGLAGRARLAAAFAGAAVAGAAVGSADAHAECAHRDPERAISSPGEIGSEHTPQVVAYFAVIGTAPA